jgi:hypothetical protein
VGPAELSLAENIVCMPVHQVHPADQFAAFCDLINNCASVAEVAARLRAMSRRATGSCAIAAEAVREWRAVDTNTAHIERGGPW